MNAMQLGECAFTLRSRVSRRCRMSRRCRTSRRGRMSRRGGMSMCGCVSMCDRGPVSDRVSVRRSYRVTVRCTNSVHLVPTGIVAVVSATMMSAAMMRATVTARKAEERHGSHAGRTENNAEDV